MVGSFFVLSMPFTGGEPPIIMFIGLFDAANSARSFSCRATARNIDVHYARGMKLESA